MLKSQLEQLATIAVDCGFQIHKRLGPGLLEYVYEALMAHDLVKRGLSVIRQQVVPVHYDGIMLDEGFRADLMIEGQLLVELKSVERFAPVHGKQVLTYLRLLNLPLGLLINFGAETYREGVKRVANNYQDQ